MSIDDPKGGMRKKIYEKWTYILESGKVLKYALVTSKD
jgi:hypothetical protein